MKKNKKALTIERHLGDILLDGYAVVTFSNDDLKIIKSLLTESINEVNRYVKD